MAISLNGTTQYVSRTNPLTSYPFTIAGWSRANDATANHGTWRIFQSGGIDNYNICGLLGAEVGDPARTDAYPGSGAVAATTTGYSANTWHHVASVMTSASSFATLIDGGSKGTNGGTYSGTLANALSFTFGYLEAFGGSYYAQGDHAEYGLWSVALTDSEVASLAKGYSPLEIRPASLVAYYPFGGHYGRNAKDCWKNKYDLTEAGSPTYTDHPRLIYPQATWCGSYTAAGGGGFKPYWAGRKSRMIGGGIT